MAPEMYRVDVYLPVRRVVMVEGMSIREASRVFGLHRDTVRQMLAYSAPPGCRRENPPRCPKLEPYTGVIDQILERTTASPGSSATRPSPSMRGSGTSTGGVNC